MVWVFQVANISINICLGWFGRRAAAHYRVRGDATRLPPLAAPGRDTLPTCSGGNSLPLVVRFRQPFDRTVRSDNIPPPVAHLTAPLPAVMTNGATRGYTGLGHAFITAVATRACSVQTNQTPPPPYVDNTISVMSTATAHHFTGPARTHCSGTPRAPRGNSYVFRQVDRVLPLVVGRTFPVATSVLFATGLDSHFADWCILVG